MNMGACMAPAAAEVIYQHFVDFGSKPEDYDAVYTGDLGEVGKKILLHLLRENGYDLSKFMGIVELKSMRMRRRILILGALAVPVVQWFLHR